MKQEKKKLVECPKEKSFGTIYNEHMTSVKPERYDPMEVAEAMLVDYMPDLIARVQRDAKVIDGDFYMEVFLTKEPLMPTAVGYLIRPARHTMPTPEPDQTVFFFNREKEELEYMWTIPDANTIVYLAVNRHLVDPIDKVLLTYIDQYSSRELHIKAANEDKKLLKKNEVNVNEFKKEFGDPLI